MSDTSQGEGWWQASDGKWYPPSAVPAPPVPPPFHGVAPTGVEPGGSPPDFGQARTLGEPKRVRSRLLIGVTIAALAFAVVIVVAVSKLTGGSDSSVSSSSASAETPDPGTKSQAPCGATRECAPEQLGPPPAGWCQDARVGAEGFAASQENTSGMPLSELERIRDALRAGKDAWVRLRTLPPSGLASAFSALKSFSPDSVSISERESYAAAEKKIRSYVADECDVDLEVSFYRKVWTG